MKNHGVLGRVTRKMICWCGVNGFVVTLPARGDGVVLPISF